MNDKCLLSWPWRVAPHPRSLASRLLLIAALAALCTAPRASVAQNLPTVVPVSTASSQSVKLMVGEGRVLLFDGPVESVFVANSAIGDVKVIAPDTVYVWGKKSGTTNLIALSAGRKIQATIDFRVSINPEPPNEAQRQLQPTSATKISILGERAVVTGRTNGIEGAVDDQNTAEIYSPPGQPPLNNGTLPGSQQVNIRVRFAEVSRNELQQHGFNWRIFGSVGNQTVGKSGIMGSGINIDVLVEALQRKGLLTILAEPNLTAVTGETASFLAGSEVPVPIAQPTGMMSVEYKPVGVKLEFTPTIIKTNRIALHVRPEVSAISPTGGVKSNGTDLPAFNVRRTDTTVEVASGQTFAIAGLFQRQLSQQLDKLPFVGDMPVLGALFTSEHYRRDETELVILITPYLVKPSSHMIATPLDRPAPRPPIRTVATGPKRSGFIVK